MDNDLTKLSNKEHQTAIANLVKLSTQELRKRQKIVADQMKKAHSDKNEQAMKNLMVREKHLDQAIMKKNFKESIEDRIGKLLGD